MMLVPCGTVADHEEMIRWHSSDYVGNTAMQCRIVVYQAAYQDRWVAKNAVPAACAPLVD